MTLQLQPTLSKQAHYLYSPLQLWLQKASNTEILKTFTGLIHLPGKALIIWTISITEELLGYLPSEGNQTLVTLSQQL